MIKIILIISGLWIGWNGISLAWYVGKALASGLPTGGRAMWFWLAISSIMSALMTAMGMAMLRQAFRM